jgi:hypothetical protein
MIIIRTVFSIDRIVLLLLILLLKLSLSYTRARFDVVMFLPPSVFVSRHLSPPSSCVIYSLPLYSSILRLCVLYSAAVWGGVRVLIRLRPRQRTGTRSWRFLPVARCFLRRFFFLFHFPTQCEMRRNGQQVPDDRRLLVSAHHHHHPPTVLALIFCLLPFSRPDFLFRFFSCRWPSSDVPTNAYSYYKRFCVSCVTYLANLLVFKAPLMDVQSCAVVLYGSPRSLRNKLINNTKQFIR